MEHRRTRNGAAIRNRHSWVWLCRHCHQLTVISGLEDAGVDPQTWADSIDAIHWCEHKE